MGKKLLCVLLAACVPGGVHGFTDSLWIVARDGAPGALVPVQAWLQYEGAGPDDAISAFDIVLTWDASVCTVEAVTIGAAFVEARWWTGSRIDNEGTAGPPAVPKISASSFSMMPIGPPYLERGTYLGATIDIRILSSAAPPESVCFDTLMSAFTPPVFLEFVDKAGISVYVPSFSTDCIHVIPCSCGDCNGDGRVTVADAIYTSTYIYKCGHVPACEADVNQDSRITIADAIYTLTYIYKEGPDPCNPP